jgi:hypothetical protein
MKTIICTALLLATTLLSPGKSPLKAELLKPSDPVALKTEDQATLAKISAALKEKAELAKARKADPSKKPDRTRQAELAKIISSGYKLTQGTALTLRLTNTREKAITINYGGDTSAHTFTITGPEALNLKFEGMMTMEYRMGKATTIAPGKSLDFPLPELRYGGRNSSRWLLAAPGDYKIKLAFQTNIEKEKLNIDSNEITLVVKE